MIVVFVVDTSPSMAAPSNADAGPGVARGISRLDVAKMSVENVARGMDKRVMEHNRSVLLASAQAQAQASMAAAGKQHHHQQQQQQQQDVGRLEQFDEFLLLSSSLQPDAMPRRRRRRRRANSVSPSSENGESGGRDSAADDDDDDGDSSESSSSVASAAAESHASCGAGGRLLVGPVEEQQQGAAGSSPFFFGAAPNPGAAPRPPDRSDFERELKGLKTPAVASSSSSSSGRKFPEWAGGARGLNAALSHGLGLLSRYRLSRGRVVEHFGMGRLPWGEHQMAKLSTKGADNAGGGGCAGGGDALAATDSPLQPACLILITDGECLRSSPEDGGGNLSLRFGNMPLREFYREPFRWDQRIFILHVAGSASAPPLHKSLRALCEVTGGAHARIGQSAQLPSSLSKILMRVAPPRPRPRSISDPLRLPTMPPPPSSSADDGDNGAPSSDVGRTKTAPSNGVFVNGGPVCSFQCLEGGGGQHQGAPSLHRAMILFAGPCEQTRWILNSEASTPNNNNSRPPRAAAVGSSSQSPVWCIPESHFPSKKLDTLPPRPSQPVLHYSRNFQGVGSPVFDPYYVMKALHHLDHVQKMIRGLLVDAGDNNPPPMASRMLQRDVYICEWLGGHEVASSPRSGPNDPSNANGAPRTMAGREHFPVCVRGAGRPNLSGEGGDNILNIGILHVPHNWFGLKDCMNASRNDSSTTTDRIPTLTLLPPEAHILIPLLIKIAELELRIIKKLESKEAGPKAGAGATAGLIKKKVSSATAARAIHVDDNWKADFRAYLFRLPPYYLPAIRRVLRPMLPPGALSLLNYDAVQESLPSLCFSPACLLKIQQGEKAARDGNDWLRGTEQNLRMRRTRSTQETQLATEHLQALGRRGESRSGTATKGGSQQQQQDENSLAVGYGQYDPRMNVHQYLSSLRNLPPPWKRGVKATGDDGNKSGSITLLPSSCLLPYYESRRRWIFGGTGLTTRHLHVEGVNNDGVNVHHYDVNQKMEDEPLIALAGVGAHTTNQTSIARMGDFKERLNFAPSTFVDYGGTSAVGASVTTASDGSPCYSVDDDVLPLNFFDAATGEFVDSEASRARSRLTINFGNPFHDKRGGSLVPEKFATQRPPLHVGDNGPSTPPGSPPHDEYDSHSIEGEGEADFIGKRPATPPPPRGPRKLVDTKLLSLKPKRLIGAPLGTGEEKRRRTLPPEGMAKHADAKAKPHPPSAPSSPHPPPPRSRPPPPRRHSSSTPPPPPKPSQSQKPAPPKPAPPKRQKTKDLLPQTSAHSDSQPLQTNQTQRHAPQKPGTTKPAAPPKRQGEKAPQIAGAQWNPKQQPPDLAAQLQTPGVKPKINLPEGWICVWSKSQKRWYFFDTRTNKSVWDIDHIKATH